MRDGKFTPEFDAFVKEKLDKWHVPGMSIAVIQGDDVCAKGYGFARLPDEPVRPETLFNCASMTKAFTATATSLLVDDKNHPDVKWDTPMSHLIGDDFVLSDGRYTAEVTIEDMLSHRSGLPDCDDACYGIYAKNPDNTKSIVRKLRHIPLVSPLRTTYNYCNVGYTVVAHMIERLTGQWFGDFLREKIWEPLGMKNTYYGLDDLRKRRGTDDLAKSYRWDKIEEKNEEMPWCDQPEGSGCGEVFSNVLDYAAFLKCMMKKSGPISEEGHKELVAPRIITSPGEEPMPFMAHRLYALGWEIENFHGERTVGHDGAVTGFACKMLYIPRLNWGMVAFGNKDFANDAIDGIAWGLVDDLMGIPEEQRFDWDEDAQRIWDKYEPKTREQLFPKIPDPPIPLSRPLSEYAGVYNHPGFGDMVVELKDGKLQVDATDRTWRFMHYLDHVSGDFFFVDRVEVPSKETGTGKAQFRINADGRVIAFGMDLIAGMEDEKEPIWFERGDLHEGKDEGGSG
ncbi:penicillin-binding protein [Mollisia scopiformis]|uniref:Penicillin-binding protein n=1 Tax=Mollisia scopiformis TaxID=149040 RepID=A0A194XQM2_MOLSC|nr:penicillin-binding protein [Mollisia scopiformis]KUJ22570.1 penicillin-binding protein [Mollisia scopiformis]